MVLCVVWSQRAIYRLAVCTQRMSVSSKSASDSRSGAIIADIISDNRGAVRRYLQGKAKWDKKVCAVSVSPSLKLTGVPRTKYVEKRIHEKRRRNVKRAAREEAKRLKGKASRHRKKKDSQSNDEQTDEEEVAGTWAHIDGERPPPSSIAARRDTVRRSSPALTQRLTSRTARCLTNGIFAQTI